MHIILLSGGLGKRLWPLSNSARCKQFLQLLQTPDGQKESMVQRVVRQIEESTLEASVLVVSGASQRDSIEVQLGAKVESVMLLVTFLPLMVTRDLPVAACIWVKNIPPVPHRSVVPSSLVSWVSSMAIFSIVSHVQVPALI